MPRVDFSKLKPYQLPLVQLYVTLIPLTPRYQFSCFLLVVAQNQFLWHDSMIEGDGIYCRRFNYGGTWYKLAFS